MKIFWSTIVRPLLEIIRAKKIIEIGSENGEHSVKLARWAQQNSALLAVIDPLPLFDVAEFEKTYSGHAEIHITRSLDILRDLLPADVVLIDGDHNWYTVYHECKILFGNGEHLDGNAPIVLCHDIGWPFGRRDAYYNLEDIPEHMRQPANSREIHPSLKTSGDKEALVTYPHAECEGGARNGVRTALDDALAPLRDKLRIVWVEMFNGLAIIVPNSRLAGNIELANFLDQFEASRTIKSLIALLEKDRIIHSLRSAKLHALEGNRPERHPIEIKSRPFTSAVSGQAARDILSGMALSRYQGRTLLLNPFDMAHYLQLLGHLRPATIIEVGTFEGGRALWLADTAQSMAIDCQIIGIDVAPPELHGERRIEVIRGDALDLGATLSKEKLHHLPHPWLVIEDSEHTFETSSAVLDFFDPFMKSGDYIVVEDGNISDLIETTDLCGPAQAIDNFLALRGQDYEIDTEICDRFGYNMTANPNGWLRRR